MDSARRIIINTLAQYSRAVLNILLSLYSTRLIVQSLGESDYGLYIVVGGVVALLGFITNALVITTQRYVSFYFGKGDKLVVKKVFANSLLIHIIFSLIMVCVLFSFKYILIHSWLNIEPSRLLIAERVYDVSMFMLVVTIMTAPYKALYIARENITYISIVEVCDGFLKLGIAAYLLSSNYDRLILYAVFMLGIQLVNFIAYVSYGLRKYDECQILIRRKDLDVSLMKQLLGFGGWTTYSMGAIVFRSQGIQVMLNQVYGTVINAAYGIALQVFGSISFVASSVLNAMNPQIMKAEGSGDRQRMLLLAQKECKYSTMLMLLLIVPIIFETTGILQWWLKSMPENADLFCRFILCGFIFDQFTYGINTVNQASGKIRNYVLLMYSPKLLILVPIYFMLQANMDPVWVMCVYLASEIFVSLSRLPYIKHTHGLSIKHFFKNVAFPLLPLLIAQASVAYVCVTFLNVPYRFLITIVICVLIGSIVAWHFSFCKEERQYVITNVLKRTSK